MILSIYQTGMSMRKQLFAGETMKAISLPRAVKAWTVKNSVMINCACGFFHAAKCRITMGS